MMGEMAIFFFFYLIICILYYATNIPACNSEVMAYKKTHPLYQWPTSTNTNKSPGDDSDYGPSPTAHQLPQARGRPPQGKTTIGRKGNEKFPNLNEDHRKKHTRK